MCSARSGSSGCGRYCRWRASTTRRGWPFWRPTRGCSRAVMCCAASACSATICGPSWRGRAPPRTGRQTVRRMAQRSTVLNPVSADDEWAVVAYLIAITPTLQQTVELLREQQQQAGEAAAAMRSAGEAVMEIDYDPEAARELFAATCSQCHSQTRVEQSPPGSVDEARALVQRMVSNGLAASEQDLARSSATSSRPSSQGRKRRAIRLLGVCRRGRPQGRPSASKASIAAPSEEGCSTVTVRPRNQA